MQVPPESDRMDALTEMMYAMAAHVVKPARISAVNFDPGRSL